MPLSMGGSGEVIGVRLDVDGQRAFSRDVDRARRDVDQFGDKVNRVDRSARRSGKGMGIMGAGVRGVTKAAKIGVVAVGALGAGIVGLGVKVTNLATDANETASKFNTVFAGMTEQVGGFVAETNREFGIPTKELQDAASTFGVFAKAAEVPQDQLAEFSTSLTGAGLDLASFYNVEPGDALTALRSGLAGEAEPLRKFGIFLSQATMEAKASQMGLSGELTESQKVMVRQKIIMESLGDAEGDLARTSDSLANKKRALKGRFEEAGTAIGTAFLPYVSDAAAALDNKLGPVVADLTEDAPKFGEAFDVAFSGGKFAHENSPLLKAAVRMGDLGHDLKPLWEDVSTAFQDDGIRGVVSAFDDALGTGGLLTDTFDSLMGIVDSLGTIWTDMFLPVIVDFNEAIPKGIRPLEVVEDVLGFIADNAETLQPILAGLLTGFIAYKVVSGIMAAVATAQWAINAAMAANPIGLVVIALAALAGGLIYAYNNSETFREIVKGAFDAVAGAASWVLDFFKNNWPEILGFITGPIGIAVVTVIRHWDTIKGGFFGMVNGILTAWNALDLEIGPWEIPSWVPGGLGGKTFHIADMFPDVPLISSGSGPRRVATPGGVTMHTGGTVTEGGSAIIRPDEEMVVLPPAASVVPLEQPPDDVARDMRRGRDPREPMVVQVVVDRKVLAETMVDGLAERKARK